MKNKTKQRKRYTPKRADYRNGGRVGYQEAGMVNEREMFNRANEEAMRQAQQASSPTTSTSPATAQQPIEQAPVITPEKTEQAVVAPPQTTEPEITTIPTGGGNFLQKIRFIAIVFQILMA